MEAVLLVHGGHLMGVLQLVNKEDMGFFSAQDERNGFLIAQALALALYNHKKNESAVVESGDKFERANSESLSRTSEVSETVKQDSSANILIQREDDETMILVRILKDGSRFVYQKIDLPRDVIKLIKEVASIDLDLPPKPHRRKDDPRY